MKKLHLYLNGKSTFDGWREWWAGRDESGSDFIECIDRRDFLVPDPWTKVYIDSHGGNVLRHSVEFETDSGKCGYIGTNANGKPVIVDETTGAHTHLIEING